MDMITSQPLSLLLSSWPTLSNTTTRNKILITLIITVINHECQTITITTTTTTMIIIKHQKSNIDDDDHDRKREREKEIKEIRKNPLSMNGNESKKEKF